jgi:Flp pilus assembly protein TadG
MLEKLRTVLFAAANGSAKRRRSRGIYTTLLALWLPLFIGAMGLGVDISHFWWVRGQLQNAADAAAFAGARELNSTNIGRTTATGMSSTYARKHSVNGATVTTTDITQNDTGAWNLRTGDFTTTNVSDPAANAIRVTVTRQDVPTFFTRILSGALSSQTLSASAIALAGGTGAVACGFPVVMASCQLKYDGGGNLQCPTNMTFQTGGNAVGMTHPDGTSPISGNNTKPYFNNALADPMGCDQKVEAGDQLYLQNGNDIAQQSVNDINAVTKNGTKPLQIIVPVVDTPCGTSGPSYNGTANVVGFLKMKLVGARWTTAAPDSVAAACPNIGMKNVCITADCSMIQNTPGGGTVQTSADRIYLVR